MGEGRQERSQTRIEIGEQGHIVRLDGRELIGASDRAMRGLRGVDWIFLDMSKFSLYLGTISPTCMERSFQDVK